MKAFWIALVFVVVVPIGLGGILIAEKWWPSSTPASIAFGFGGLAIGIFVAMGIEYFSLRIRQINGKP